MDHNVHSRDGHQHEQQQQHQQHQQQQPQLESLQSSSSSSSSSSAALVCQFLDSSHEVICGAVFDGPDELLEHLGAVHVGRKSMHNLNLFCRWPGCSHTATAFHKRDHIISHLKTHLPLRTYVCEVCHHSYKWVHDYSKHRLKSGHGVTTLGAMPIASSLSSSFASLPSHGSSVSSTPPSTSTSASSSTSASASVAADMSNLHPKLKGHDHESHEDLADRPQKRSHVHVHAHLRPILPAPPKPSAPQPLQPNAPPSSSSLSSLPSTSSASLPSASQFHPVNLTANTNIITQQQPRFAMRHLHPHLYPQRHSHASTRPPMPIHATQSSSASSQMPAVPLLHPQPAAPPIHPPTMPAASSAPASALTTSPAFSATSSLSPASSWGTGLSADPIKHRSVSPLPPFPFPALAAPSRDDTRSPPANSAIQEFLDSLSLSSSAFVVPPSPHLHHPPSHPTATANLQELAGAQSATPRSSAFDLAGLMPMSVFATSTAASASASAPPAPAAWFLSHIPMEITTSEASSVSVASSVGSAPSNDTKPFVSESAPLQTAAGPTAAMLDAGSMTSVVNTALAADTSVEMDMMRLLAPAPTPTPPTLQHPAPAAANTTVDQLLIELFADENDDSSPMYSINQPYP